MHLLVGGPNPRLIFMSLKDVEQSVGCTYCHFSTLISRARRVPFDTMNPHTLKTLRVEIGFTLFSNLIWHIFLFKRPQIRYFGPFFRSTNFYFYLVFLRFPTISCFCFPITFLLILQKWKQPLVLTSKSTRLSGNCIIVKPNVFLQKRVEEDVGQLLYYKPIF